MVQSGDEFASAVRQGHDDLCLATTFPSSRTTTSSSFRPLAPRRSQAVPGKRAHRPSHTMKGRGIHVKFFENLALFLILLIRGVLLWLVIPLGFLAWMLMHSWAQRVSLRQALAWYDFTAVSVLMNGPFRFMIRRTRRAPLLGLSRMGESEAHRVRLSDLADFSIG